MSEEWSPRALSSLSRYVNGFAFKPHHWVKEGLPIVRIEQLNNPDGVYDFCSTTVPTDNIIDDGDLIFSWSATLKVALWRHGKAALNQHLFKVLPNADTDKGFLFQLLDYHMDALAGGSHGSTMKHIKRSELDKYIVSVPERDEQVFLARILGALDTQIGATEGLIAKQERVRAGLMQDLLTRGVDDHGQLRPPRDQAPHLYHQTELGWLPQGWEVVLMGNFIQKIDSGWSPNCDNQTASDDEWGVLKTTAVVWPGYDSSENKRLPDSSKQLRSVETKPGDILITRKGPMERVGVAVYVESTRPRLMFPDTVFRTRALPSDALIPRFLVTAMQSDAVQKHWWQRKVGLADAQVNINHGIVRNTPFQLPPQDEQRRILAAISTYEAIQRDYQRELPKLSLQKSGLMQDLLTGKVSVAPLLESHLESAAA